uniref:Chlorophyll a-b binding protein, chloroplastic n=2 Tax=Eukaryota TaxID=2759 RepID=A0A7S3R4R1_DUNTE|mmetsp:Transcript_13967/g.37733  ORF Transcript_13967/g.37733 Transcript_13967/m.37733 type:complete len:256 (+) Transcript_13967:71-838(+)|eukprot:CAMPEP_0202337320 /NCGR_PEP_ID=MMETSP1126-20121109/42_1 /ASSEMBLY_ACC=CAM_ASM_000457 /TAXON_ID=3047 /ORGANISM="Dunaliella tertiolecta, Strain CCMP1320" /LENGTH=255 /DNA_ID=CAMNT_0048927473 /DNA_START=67 /DNA_END=834 /DNA_ORIENTATION=-
MSMLLNKSVSLQTSAKASQAARSVAPRSVASRRNVAARAGADRPLWSPGSQPPAWLDGSLAGDYGFDPLHLSEEPEMRKWMVQAELVHARWAMLGVAGILFTSIAAKNGAPFPDWYDAGKEAIKTSPAPLGSLIFTELLLFGWVETKRLYDLRNPGSQGDGSFLGITDGLKGKENGYPGGLFDPMGMSKNEASFKEAKVKEIKNGRLAMLAFVGFIAQHHATHKSPIDNLVDHVADPFHVTFATNGVSVPHFTEF